MFIQLLIALIATNLIAASIMYKFFNDDDMNGLRKGGPDRFADLFYFSIVSFSTAGYGDISPNSTRAKMFVSSYLMFVNIAAIYGIYTALIQA
jgi:hypothetical protein